MLELFPAFVLFVKILTSRRHTQDGCFGVGEIKDKRAEYGEQVVKNLANSLTEKYGKGFRQANLYHFIAFYNYHQNFFYAVSRKSEEADEEEIFHAVSRKSENIQDTEGLSRCVQG